MFRSCVIVFMLVLVCGCVQEVERKVVESSGDNNKSTEAIISKEREAVASDSGLPQPKTEHDLLECEPMHGTSVYCGYQNPEDLVLLPDRSALLVSEMGEFMLDAPGNLSLLDLAGGERREIPIDWSGGGWGVEGCLAPDVAAFSPHGIDLTTRSDGLHQLLVVNHGKREAVEFFELVEDDGNWRLSWRGCALPPGDPFINDVAGLKDGGFFVTHMWDKSTPFEKVVEQYMKGEKIGWVWEWQKDKGFTKVAGSDELMPNGIAVSADNNKIFVNIYLANKTLRIDRESGEVDGSLILQQPDNITIDDEGSLWIASHKHDALGQTCAQVREGPCLLPYEILKIEPETMLPLMVISADGPPMGYATVALRVNEKVYIGSAHGDRVASRLISRSSN